MGGANSFIQESVTSIVSSEILRGIGVMWFPIIFLCEHNAKRRGGGQRRGDMGGLASGLKGSFR